MKLYEVPNCPAYAHDGLATCLAHKDARLAKELRISQQVNGRNGKRCLKCRRVFRPDDYVNSKPRLKKKRSSRPGDPYGWVHVACEPLAPRLAKRAIRESVKPLLEVADDTAGDRGTARQDRGAS
jgi:hypothetical protein